LIREQRAISKAPGLAWH